MAYLISRHPLLVITLSVATSIFAALTGTRLVNLTIIDMSTGMNTAGTIQAREAAAVQELVKRAAGRAERLARTRSHARPSTPSPPPAQPTPLARSCHWCRSAATASTPALSSCRAGRAYRLITRPSEPVSVHMGSRSAPLRHS